MSVNLAEIIVVPRDRPHPEVVEVHQTTRDISLFRYISIFSIVAISVMWGLEVYDLKQHHERRGDSILGQSIACLVMKFFVAGTIMTSPAESPRGIRVSYVILILLVIAIDICVVATGLEYVKLWVMITRTCIVASVYVGWVLLIALADYLHVIRTTHVRPHVHRVHVIRTTHVRPHVHRGFVLDIDRVDIQTFECDDVCPICHAPYSTPSVQWTITKCGHVFCEGCIHEWAPRRSSKCPICRMSIVKTSST